MQNNIEIVEKYTVQMSEGLSEAANGFYPFMQTLPTANNRYQEQSNSC